MSNANKRKHPSSTEQVVVENNNETTSADEPTTFVSSSPVSTNDIKIIKKKAVKKAEAPINQFKYYISKADLEASIHENEFKQFNEYTTWQQHFADKDRKYKITNTSKENAAIANSLNADWQKECTGEDPCRRYNGYLPGVSYPIKEIYDYTNNSKLKAELTLLLSYKKIMQDRFQKHQVGNPLYWPRFKLPNASTPIPSPSRTPPPSRSPSPERFKQKKKKKRSDDDKQ